MCGIAGFLDPSRRWSEAELRQIGERMGMKIQHRGPDDSGLWIDHKGELGLVFRRLSILDLSEAGHQPMVSPGGRWVIVLNGEIYNFEQLKKDVQQSGKYPHPFRGHSDT